VLADSGRAVSTRGKAEAEVPPLGDGGSGSGGLDRFVAAAPEARREL